jgi:anti-sigma B factor antagonist
MASAPEGEFKVATETTSEYFLVAPSGELDLDTVDEVRTAIASRPEDCRMLMLDLRGLTFFDTSGMRLVVATMRQCDQDGIAFALVRGTDAVQRLFALARMEDRLPFLDDPSEAFTR